MVKIEFQAFRKRKVTYFGRFLFWATTSLTSLTAESAAAADRHWRWGEDIDPSPRMVEFYHGRGPQFTTRFPLEDIMGLTGPTGPTESMERKRSSSRDAERRTSEKSDQKTDKNTYTY